MEVPLDLEAARSLMAPLARLSRHTPLRMAPISRVLRWKGLLWGFQHREVVERPNFRAFLLHCSDDMPDVGCEAPVVNDAETRP